MLKPALLYTQEITRKFAEHLYTTDYFYYCGYPCGNSLPKIEEKDDLYQYASVYDLAAANLCTRNTAHKQIACSHRDIRGTVS